LRADFPVILDACVLAEAAVSDLFLRLSEEPRLLIPKWTEATWAETHRTWTEKLGWPEQLASSRLNAAFGAFPEAMVTGFEHLIPECTNHPNDRHVLAAAIQAGVETIVTFNTRDFTPASLEPWGITAVQPANFLKILYDHDPAVVTSALYAMAGKAARTMPEMLARLSWYVSPFSEYVAAAQAIILPEVPPAAWKR